MSKDFVPFDLRQIKTYPLGRRKSLVHLADFAKPILPSKSVRDFLDSLPNVLGASALRRLADRVVLVRKRKRPLVVGFGAHVIKCGLGPILVDLMERGIITALATHGASCVHDFELALTGETSEDVGASLKKGKFGMARETAEALSQAAKSAARRARGLGFALGEKIEKEKLPHREVSVFASAYRLKIPLTVHVAIGTDTFHMHPCLDAGSLGMSSHTDFKIFCSVVRGLSGGVYLNIGSAVILPEVFLKAVSVAHNTGAHLSRVFTANLDMIQHYRGRVNVLERPSDESVYLTGHHEIMVPLLAAAILSRLGE